MNHDKRNEIAERIASGYYDRIEVIDETADIIHRRLFSDGPACPSCGRAMRVRDWNWSCPRCGYVRTKPELIRGPNVLFSAVVLCVAIVGVAAIVWWVW